VRKVAALGAVGLALALTAGAGVLTRAHPAAVAAVAQPVACGHERWPEKTLADPFASSVHLTAVPKTVEALRARDRVVGIGGVRGLGTERTVFKVKADLVGIKQEADSDFHLVIADRTTGHTMIAEFPNESCTLGATASLRTKMQKARVAIADACGFAPNSSFHRIGGTATITGVGFFDNAHATPPTGDAKRTHIELHPVLKFSGACS
jgi:hypothetical protein